MSAGRVLRIARHELAIVWRNRFWFLALVGMPLVLIAFVRPLYRFTAAAQGYAGVDGSGHAVPGMAVMFVFFLVGVVGVSFYSEFGWATWDRLRTVASPPELMSGKVLPFVALGLFQQSAVFAVGFVVFDLDVRGPVVALVPVAVCLVAALVALGIAVVGLTTTIQQVGIVQSVGAMVMAGVGGALTPVAFLPGWARSVAPVTPTYWALRGYRAVVLDGQGFGAVGLPCLVLLLFAAGFAVIGALRFRVAPASRTYV